MSTVEDLILMEGNDGVRQELSLNTIYRVITRLYCDHYTGLYSCLRSDICVKDCGFPLQSLPCGNKPSIWQDTREFKMEDCG